MRIILQDAFVKKKALHNCWMRLIYKITIGWPSPRSWVKLLHGPSVAGLERCPVHGQVPKWPPWLIVLGTFSPDFSASKTWDQELALELFVCPNVQTHLRIFFVIMAYCFDWPPTNATSSMPRLGLPTRSFSRFLDEHNPATHGVLWLASNKCYQQHARNFFHLVLPQFTNSQSQLVGSLQFTITASRGRNRGGHHESLQPRATPPAIRGPGWCKSPPRRWQEAAAKPTTETSEVQRALPGGSRSLQCHRVQET